jgi:hypothetical protein
MSKPPKGWQGWDPCSDDKNRPVECGNCGWTGREDEVDEYIPDLSERIDAGMIVPVGCCTAPRGGTYLCGSLVYYTDVEIIYRRKPGVLDKIVEATE